MRVRVLPRAPFLYVVMSMVNVYQVGGSVRDEILGLHSKDIDYAVEASSYEEMRDWVYQNTDKVFLETPQFFTIRALRNGEAVDFVLCRKEGTYSDGRHPDKVEVGTIYDDLARRDFTMNAIAKRDDGSYLDPHGGVVDLKYNTIRCVGETRARFEEDPLRILRAMRFSITKDMFISGDIAETFRNVSMMHRLQGASLSVERIREELLKCFAHSTSSTMTWFRDYPMLDYCLRDGLWLAPTLKKA
jgi:tRNA nucleotidyltransferase (CCA-adding enzyme)